MANTKNTLGNTLVAQVALKVFVARVMPIMAFSRNFAEAMVAKGDKVKVLYCNAAAAAQDWVAANGYTIQDDVYDGLDISLNKRKYVSWHLTSEELADNPQLNLERLGTIKGATLAKAVVQDILSLVTVANYGAAAYAGAGANFDSDEVANLEVICDEANWPTEERSLILAPSYHAGIVKDDSVAGTIGVEASGVLQRSAVKNLHNFSIYKSNIIPANAENLTGMAVQPDAILAAMRVVKPDDKRNTIDFEVMADPDGSGIALGFREWFDPDKDRTIRVLECSYGYLKGNAAALKRITS